MSLFLYLPQHCLWADFSVCPSWWHAKSRINPFLVTELCLCEIFLSLVWMIFLKRKFILVRISLVHQERLFLALGEQDVGRVEMHQTDLIEKGNSYSNCMVPYSFLRIIIKFMSPAKGALLSFTDIFLLLSLSLVGTLTFSYVSQLMPQNYSIYKCNNWTDNFNKIQLDFRLHSFLFFIECKL